jgi:hypothetical protein
MKKLTFMFAMLLMAVVSFAQEVTLPEGLTTEEYEFTATKLASGFGLDEEVSRTVNVAFDGNDVYVQGLSDNQTYASSWVKGVVNGDQITFEKEQELYVQDLGILVVKGVFNPNSDVVFAYDAANNKMTADAYEISEDNGEGYHAIEQYANVVIAKAGGETPVDEPTVVTLPEGVTAVDYQMTATTLKNYNRVDVNRTVKVAVDGTDVYMQGLAECLPEAWVKGMLGGDEVVFEGSQLLGDNDGFDAMFEPDHEHIAFTYDAAADKYTISAYELQAKSYTWEQYESVVITKANGGDVPGDDPIEPQGDFTISPEGVQQTSLSTFVVTFNNFGVSTLGSEENATLKNNTTGVEQTAVMEISEDKKVVTMNFEETTEPGKYTLTLGDLWNASTYQMLDPITANYEIAGAVEQLTWTAIPEAGEVEKIEIVTVSFNKMVEVADGAQAYLFKGEEELQAKDITLTGGDKAVFVAFDEVTEAGEYQVVIPEGINTLEGEAVPEIAINYTIVGEAPVLACEIDPAAGEVTSIKDFTLTFNGEVGLDAYEAQAVLTGGNLEEAVKAPLAISEDHKVVTFSFDEITEAGEYTLTIPEGAIFNRATFEDVAEMTFNYTIVGGEDDPTQPVVVPATATIEDWTLEGSLYASGGIQNLNQGTKVAFEGENIYIQGLCQYLPEAWVKGTFADGKAVLKSGQIYGTLEEGGETYEFYMMGANADSEGNLTLVDEFVLNYDADAEKFTLEDGVYILDNSNNTTPSFYDLFMSLVLTKGKYVAPEVVELPEGAVVEDWQYEAYDNYYQETVTRPSQVAFVGNEVYVNGITEVLPEAWIKGTLDGDKVTFAANQYLGHYESSYGSLDLFFNPEADVVFGYDAEAGKLTAAEYVTFTGSYNYDEMSDVVITKVPEAAAVPATPTINEVEIATYSYMGATIPATSVDGEALAASKLYYMILVEKAKDQSEPFVLKAENYTPYEEDMTEIPYMFNDAENYYIQAYGDVHYVYLLTDAEEIDTWYRLGVKSIYYGGGEVNESEIAWYTIKEYPTSVTGISEIAAEDEGSVYYDAMGRRTNSQAKGLLLKQVRMADGSVKTVKIARK